MKYKKHLIFGEFAGQEGTMVVLYDHHKSKDFFMMLSWPELSGKQMVVYVFVPKT